MARTSCSLALVLVTLLAACSGCSEPPQPTGPAVDAEAPTYPRRVITMSPGLTSIVRQLDGAPLLVGVSDDSDPGAAMSEAGAAPLPRVGTLYRPNYEAILALKPDLVLTLQQPRLEAQLAEVGVPVMTVSLDSFQLLMDSVKDVGKRLGLVDQALDLESRTASRIIELRDQLRDLPRQRVLFVIGGADRYVAGYQSIFQDMIKLTGGGVNAATGTDAKLYPLRDEDLERARPDAIVVSLPLAGASPAERRARIRREKRFWRRHHGVPAVDNGRVLVVDEHPFLVPGLDALEGWLSLARVLHPDALANR